MRLQTVHKKAKGKTEKQKKIDKEKKSSGPKINSNYFSTKPYKPNHGDVDLTKLTYGIISSCELQSVTTSDGVMQLTGSWTEFILIMLDALISNKPDTFKQLLSDNNVANQSFCVDTMYGKYPLSGEIPKVYSIYHSGYYLEAIFNDKNIFYAIIGLSKSLGYALNDITLHLRNLSYIDIDLNFDLLAEEESVVDLDHITPMLSQGIHLVSMSILGVTTRLHRLDVALLMFCNWVYENFGIASLMKLKPSGGTGIGIGEFVDDVACQSIHGSEVYVYTDEENESIINFLKQALITLKIDKKQVLFKFRALKAKESLKEWEVE